MVSPRARAAALICALITQFAIVAPHGPASAAAELAVAKRGPGSVLAGQTIRYELAATNPGDEPEFNLTFRDVLPFGVEYVPGSTEPATAQDPDIVVNQVELPIGSGNFVPQQTLIWRNVSDLQAGDAFTLGFSVELDATYVVGSTVENEGQAFASPDPRRLPPFDADGVPISDAAIDSATSNTVTTTLSAIEIRKSEPSPEGELLRGVHDHVTTYTLQVRVTDQGGVNDVVVTDLLPAGLEFLGCDDVDNSAAGTVEYPGAPRLGSGPTVTGCVFPDAVETVVDPAPDGSTTYPPGVYTRLTWNRGDQPAGTTITLRYAAGIPLRANAPFADPAPTPASGGQAANLDNNTGPSTRELADEAAVTNVARAVGEYLGPTVEPTSPVPVESEDSATRSVEDVRIRKSVTPGTFAAGGRAEYTVTIDSGEYVTAAAVELTDRIPNGICPLLPGANFAEPSTSPPLECQGAGVDQPTVVVDGGAPTDITFTASEDTADGGFDVEFGPLPDLPTSSTAVVTYFGSMRTTYEFGTPDGFRPVSGDGFTNTVDLVATTSPIEGTGETGEFTVGDTSSATQTTTALSLDKTILPRTLLDPTVPCPTTGYVDPDDVGVDPDDLQFRLGDRVCFRLRVDFSSTIYTRNAVVTDFLPVGVEYVAGSALATPASVLAPFEFNETEATTGIEQPTWSIGNPDGLGNTFVEPGAVFDVVLAGRVVDLPDGNSPEVRGNLMKLRTENTAGQAQSYRDGLPFEIVPAPPVGITKGVAEVDDPPFSTTEPDQDGIGVVEDSLVTYRIDLANLGSDASSNAYSVRGLEVWDALPSGVTCSQVTNISNLSGDTGGGPILGTCTNPGQAGHPTFAERATRSAIRWVFPVDPDDPAGGVDRWQIDDGQSRTLTYQLRIPTPTSFGVELVNDASVRSYQAFSNELNTGATYFPSDNVDTTVDPSDWNAPVATDPSSVVTPGATVDKTGTTSIGEGGNNVANQAVAGELLTFTYLVDIPSDTSVFEGVLSDTLPTQFELLATPAPLWRFYPDAAAATTASQPPGFSLASDGTLTFPATYTNSTATTQRFEVEITARVRNNFTQQTGYTNTARFQSLDRVGGTPLSPLTDTYTVNVRQLAPAFSKVSDVDIVSGDDIVTYTLRATNPNNRPTVHDVWLTDCIPAGLTFEEFAAGSGATLGPFPGASTRLDSSLNSFTNTCPVGTTFIAFDLDQLPPNADVTRVYRARVDLTAVGGDIYTNSARLTGSTLDDGATNPFVTPNPTERTVSRSDDVDVRVPGSGESKTASPDRATIGETVTYTFRATIPANTNFYQSAVLDVLPPGLDPASLAFVDSSCVRLSSPAEPCGLTATPMSTTATDGAGNLLVGFRVGDVAGDEFERVLTVRYTAQVADVPANVAGTVITNEALTAWDSVDDDNVPDTPSYPWQNRDEETQTADVTVVEPDVEVTKDVSDPTPEPGQTFTYTLRLENASTSTTSSAHDLVVEDVVPVGVRVSGPSITPPPATFTPPTSTSPGFIRWALPGPLAPSDSLVLSYSAQLAPSAEIDGTAQVNTATLESYASLPAGSAGRRDYTGNIDTASVTPQFPELTVAKSAVDPVPTYLDETFTWSIDVTNVGTAPAFGLTVVDDLPTNWRYVPGTVTIALPSGSTITPEPSIDELAPAPTLTQQLEWAGLGQLAPNETLTITFRVDPTDDLLTEPGIGGAVLHTNEAIATAADGSGAAGNSDGPYASSDTAATRIDAVDLVADKFHTAAPIAGATFDWRVRVTNSSATDTAVGPFTVTDTLPTTPGVSYATAFGTGWSCSQSSGTVTCTRGGSLAPGASLPLITIRVTTDADLADGTEIANSASVTGRTYETDPTDNTDGDTATVTTAADLAVAKGLATPPVAGETATYEIEVTNLGPSVAHADGANPITVADTLPAGVSFVSASGTGWSCVHDGTFPGGVVTCDRITDLALGAAPSISVVVSVPASASGDLVNTADVSPGITDDPNAGNDTATDTTEIGAEADLVITKTALGPFVAGESTVYRLRVDNDGPSDAAATVRITDTLPAGLAYAGSSSVTGTWTCASAPDGFTCDLDGTLPFGAFAVVEVSVDVASDVLGDVTNTATVTSPTPDPDPSDDTDDATSTFVGEADLSVTKSSSGTAAPGGPVEWTVTVSNAGPSDSRGTITVTDTLPAGLTGPVTATGTGWSCTVVDLDVACTRATALPAGGSTDLTITAVVDPATPGPTAFTNTATVTPGPTTDPDPTNNGDTDVVTLVEPDVTLAKSVSHPVPQPADVFTYTISLINDAAAGTDAFDLTVRDVVPAGVDVDEATISDGGTYDTGTRAITWTIAGPLAPGAMEVLTYDASLADSSTIDDDPLTNIATLTSYESQPSGGRPYVGNDDTATVTPRFPALAATKTALGPAPTYIGDEFAWQITITNTGDGAAATLDVVDTLPDNWVYADDSTVVTPPSGSPTFPNPDAPVVGQELRWSNVGTLQPGQTLTLTFRAVPIVDVVTAPGVGSAVAHTNTAHGEATDPSGATGNADGDYESDTVEASARIDAADLVITKSSSGTAVAGEELVWTIGVANASGVDPAVGPFTVTDTVPAGVTFVDASGDGWSCTSSGATVTCTRTSIDDTLPAGAAFEPIEVTVSVPADASGELDNTAAVTGRTYELDPTDNADTDTVTVVGEADLQIVKSRSGDLVAGTPTTYELEVTNLGPSVARGPITVTDTLSPSTSFVSATGTGWTCDHDGATTGGAVACVFATDLTVGEVAPQIAITVDVASGATGEIVNTASITATTTDDPNPDNDTDDDRGTPDTVADVRIEKRALGALVAGEPATYRLRVDNDGPSDAAAPVRITDPLPAGLTYASFVSVDGTWTCDADDPNGTSFTCDLVGTLAAGAFATVDVTVDVASDVSGTIENTASVSSPTPDPNSGNNTDSDGSPFDTLADLAIAKTSPGTAIAGAELTWTLSVSNDGPSDSQAPITVTDPLPAGVAFVEAIGTGWVCTHDGAADGGLVTCTRDAVLAADTDAPPITLVVAVSPDAGPATIVNTATVDGTTNDPDPSNDSSTDGVAVTDEVDVAITKTATPDPVRAGEQVTYTLTVVNDGPSTADELVVTDALPGGLTVASVDGSADGWDCTSPSPISIQCTRASLAPLDAADPSTTTTIAVVADVATGVPDGTVLTNAAVVSTTSPDTDPSNDESTATVTVVAEADLAVEKSHPAGDVPAGGQVTFDLAVRNLGPSDAVAPIRVVDTLPTGFSFVGATGPWACTAADQDVTCELDAAVLIAGAPVPLLQITAQLDPSLDDGTVDNTATVSSGSTDPDPGNDTATDPVDIGRSADLSITKEHDADAVRIGAELEFTIVVTNAGPSDARDVVVADSLPTGLTLVAADGDGWTCALTAPTVSCALDAPLAPGAAEPITVTALVEPEAFPGLDNTATVVSETDDPTPTDNTSTDPIVVPPLVDLTIAKSQTGPVVVGGEVTYTLVVGNDGPIDDPAAITVVDELPGALTPTEATSDDADCTIAGQTVTCVEPDGLAVGAAFTVTVTAEVLPAAHPAITNAATVSSPTDDADPSNNTDEATVTVPPLVDLTIAKIHTGTAAVGGSITYEVAVRNLGPTADADPATITDTLPPSLTPRTASGSGVDCTISEQTVTCRSATPLAVGQAVSVTIVADVTAAAFPEVENTASVTTPSAETDTTNNSATDVAPVEPSIRLDVSKRVVSQDGTTVVWGIAVRNVGLNGTVDPIVVTDALPASLGFVATSGDGWTCTGGQTAVCTYAASVAADGTTTELLVTTEIVDAPGEAIVNVATAEGGGPDAESVTADASVVAPGDIPVTGSDPWTVLQVAAFAAGLGLALWFVTRRRRALTP